MIEHKHIPGPWKWGFESVDPEWAIVTIEGGLIVANVNAHHRQEANAKLIAAAPELLDACEFALTILEGMGNGNGDAAKTCRAAIAKAAA